MGDPEVVRQLERLEVFGGAQVLSQKVVEGHSGLLGGVVTQPEDVDVHEVAVVVYFDCGAIDGELDQGRKGVVGE